MPDPSEVERARELAAEWLMTQPGYDRWTKKELCRLELTSLLSAYATQIRRECAEWMQHKSFCPAGVDLAGTKRPCICGLAAAIEKEGRRCPECGSVDRNVRGRIPGDALDFSAHDYWCENKWHERGQKEGNGQ